MNKWIGRNKKFCIVLCLLILAAISSACTSSVNTGYTSSEESSVKVPNGSHSLEDCKKMGGLYISYEDGTFDKYPTGGYCYGLTTSSEYFNGLFMSNDVVANIPVITSDDKLVVFSDGYFQLYLYPVNYEVGVPQLKREDGMGGFVHLYNQNENALWGKIVYKDHERKDLKILYIDGIPSTEYTPVKIEREIKPYKGMPSKVCTSTAYGFSQNKKVTLGVAQGSSVVETTYDITATYFDCDPEHNDYTIEDCYIVLCSPTIDGYATVDMVDVFNKDAVPSGKYVMVLQSGKNYKATILNWGNNN